jgi:hypothetical protein
VIPPSVDAVVGVRGGAGGGVRGGRVGGVSVGGAGAWSVVVSPS